MKNYVTSVKLALMIQKILEAFKYAITKIKNCKQTKLQDKKKS